MRQIFPESREFQTGVGEPIEVDQPIPDALAVAAALVESGTHDEVETVIQLLQIFALEREPASLFADIQVHLNSGWGATMLAAQIYASLDEGDQKTEIDRLIRKLAPTREMLDIYALPESEYSAKSTGLLAAQKAQSVPCVSLWEDGFPDDPDDRPTCLLYRSFTSGGHEYRVYYPTERRGDPGFMSKVNIAFEALQDTESKLSAYAEVGDINLIFRDGSQTS